MLAYYESQQYRSKVQLTISIIQAVLMLLAVTFMALFVGTPAPSTRNFSVVAIVFSLLWGAYYFAQIIFAAVTYGKTAIKGKYDVMFLVGSIAYFPVACALYAISLLFI